MVESTSGINMWVLPKIGVPQTGWIIMENPIKMDDLGVPLFSETSMSVLAGFVMQMPSSVFCYVWLSFVKLNSHQFLWEMMLRGFPKAMSKEVFLFEPLVQK